MKGWRFWKDDLLKGYAYTIGYSAAEYGTESITVKAPSKELADKVIEGWCQNNYASVMSFDGETQVIE